jgi:hypothetical protein
MSERPTCNTCPFWAWFEDLDPEEDAEFIDEDGEPRPGQTGRDADVETAGCRLNPPIVNQIGDNEQIVSQWPATWAHQWCGQHPDFPAYIAAIALARGTPAK